MWACQMRSIVPTSGSLPWARKRRIWRAVRPTRTPWRRSSLVVVGGVAVQRRRVGLDAVLDLPLHVHSLRVRLRGRDMRG